MRLLPYSTIGVGIALCVVAAACDDEGEEIPKTESSAATPTAPAIPSDANVWELMTLRGLTLAGGEVAWENDGVITGLDEDACVVTRAHSVTTDNHPDVSITLYTSANEADAEAVYNRRLRAMPTIWATPVRSFTFPTLGGLDYSYAMGGGTYIYPEGAQVLEVNVRLTEQQQASNDAAIAAGASELDLPYDNLFKSIAQGYTLMVGQEVNGAACE